MIKTYSLLILLACTLVSCAQKTEKINIIGTKVFMIAPKNFSPSKNFLGLEKDKFSMINISELDGGNFYTNAATFSKKAFEDKGVKVFDYQELKIDGYPAKFIYAEAKGQKMMSLVFGDTTFCDMAMALFNGNDENTAEDIKKALFSIEYKKQMKIDHLALAYFKVNKNKSNFKFAKVAANMFLYSKDGAVKDNYKEEPMMMLVPLPVDASMDKEKLAKSLIGGLVQNGFIVIEEKNIKTTSVNGYDAYEMEVSGFMKGKKALIYSLVLVNGDKCIGIEGVTYADFDKELLEFKEMAHHVTFK